MNSGILEQMLNMESPRAGRSVQELRLCHKAGSVKLVHVTLDGMNYLEYSERLPSFN